MADENNKANSHTEDPDSEYQALKEKAERYDRLQQIADEARAKDPEEYLRFLEEQRFNELWDGDDRPPKPSADSNSKNRQPDRQTPPSQSPPPQPQPQKPRSPSAEQVAAYQATVQAQLARYESRQGRLPEEKQSKYDPSDMEQMLRTEEGALAWRMAANDPKRYPTVFDAIQRIMDINNPEIIEAAEKRGAEEADTRNRLIKNNDLPGGGPPAPAPNPTGSDEEKQAWQEMMRKRIAPKAGVFEPDNQ